MNVVNRRQALQRALMNGKNKQDAYHPFPWYESMRKEAPVTYDEDNQVWSVFLYDDVKKVIGDKELFSSYMPEQTSSIGNSIINMDPPRHTQIRSVVNRAFTPRVMKQWEPRIQDIADDLIHRFHGRSEFDLVQDFSYPLPVIVISELLGVPSEHMDAFKTWSDILVSTPRDGSEEAEKAFLKERNKCEEELAAFFAGIIEEKRKKPEQDIISILIKAEETGEKLSGEELIPFCTLLLVAGNETTTNLISNAMYSILDTPGAYDELQRNPELVPQAVEEALRFRAPAPVLRRIAKRDTEIGGHQIKEGDMVLAFVASANRDEAKFDRAHKFDIHRHPNPHIAFGHGIHFCLGAPLARLEAAIALTALTQTFSHMEPVSITPIENSVIYGLKSFRVNI
ncbi:MULTISPECIES: cytochrome P450 [Bacillus]|uniref:cytochrome P450 n=1 Tax=Bacillus TaxID=1386 RepID=UPI00039FA3F8|nr:MULTISPECIES: cytochrome P450 [Bacillus]BDG79526.1 putative cytochrome P450 YjiB [Bacillus subtilis]KUP31021.1 cytochrome P450 [Bacillus halotolerans]KUP36967.1 cytochrome P450 [Bacillus halotolerans]MBJ7569629.1 cytochrome P450 [Bacillus halotolerans]MBL4968100.1 cytochrome P450 [Bacillus halotolerans]